MSRSPYAKEATYGVKKGRGGKWKAYRKTAGVADPRAKRSAEEYAASLNKPDDRWSGAYTDSAGRVRFKNPARRKNAPKSRTVSLKGFTGKIRQHKNGALQIIGRGKKK